MAIHIQLYKTRKFSGHDQIELDVSGVNSTVLSATIIKFSTPIFFTFSYTTGLSKISCQISIYYKQYNSCFLDLYFREFTAAIDFLCSKSGLRIGENDVIFSKIPHGLKL